MSTQSPLFLALLPLLVACGNTPAQHISRDADTKGRTPLGSVALPSPAADTPVASTLPSEVSAPFATLVRTLSEPDGPFFSDNTISNETSYLQVASELAKTKPGGAYIGVGPEQNFPYIALTRPSIAFIVDIRRQNMVEHLLYKAIFSEATTRSHFLALLLGRAYEAESDPGPSASIEAVIAHAERSAVGETSFRAVHERLRAAIEHELPLDAGDKKTLELTHRSFFARQLELRFELKPSSGRRYPTLREILTQRDESNVPRGFLASEDAFRFVQTLERQGKVVPVVGDFAGDRALSGIAAYLVREKCELSTFYVSNVEQYLFEKDMWTRWNRNVSALPKRADATFVRAYLDQGRKHPREMPGHRTATILQRVADFETHRAPTPYRSFWELTTDLPGRATRNADAG